MLSERSRSITNIVIIIIILTAALLLFSACGSEAGNDVTSDNQSTEDTTAPLPTELVLVENGQSDFSVIRSENAEGYYLDTAGNVYRKLNAVFETKFDLSDDWINPYQPSPENAPEILLFDTNRAESVAALEDLIYDGYLIRVTDCKIVIVGSGLSQCTAACHYFFDTLIPEYTTDGRVAFPVGLEIKQELADEPCDIKETIADGKSIAVHIEELFNYSGTDGFTTAQGVATDGKYAYTAMKKEIGSQEFDRIIKIDMSTWEIVKVGEILPLDHANDMTYDPVRGQLAVVHMLNGNISFIDTETLEIAETVKLNFISSSIAYCETSESLFVRSGNSYIYADHNLNQISSGVLSSAPESVNSYVGQGMDMDEDFFYIPLSGNFDNIVIIYDSDGQFVTIATIDTKKESESIFHCGDDFYIQFNSKGSTICKMTFYVQFE